MKMKFKKVELPYLYNSLEPYIDEETVKTHYEKHHFGYESKFNAAIQNTVIEKNYETIEEVMKNFSEIPSELINVTKTAGGGLINHNIYWNQFVVDRDLTKIEKEYLKKIVKQFGSKEDFKKKMIEKGLSIFGSGWVWAVIEEEQIKIITTPNQENPFMNGFQEIIMGIDVWEHAYYLKYKSDRKTYIENIFNLTIVK
ncbi:MAG: superoxide dismutase [Mn/Fe] [Candidatus Tyloplasma litorale]|nr:MAG: superoxide dismutase [Mn/Fe] [Mycoplasmatales bacterium]